MAAATSHKLLIFIVAYNAQSTIEKVISRIPDELFDPAQWQTEILVIDDASPDETFRAGYRLQHAKAKITFLRNPKNLGYGGNQKLGYQYAIDQGFDFVALVHGDGQYAPEELPRLLEPLVRSEAEVVFGSRMLKPRDAIRGGMPVYKFLGNKVLTWLENTIVGSKLSEWHSGYRLYSVAALKKVPFSYNADYFDFDTDIIIQMHAAGNRIAELPIPTFYGDEICHVNGLQYAAKIVLSCVLYRLQGLGIFYQSKFDVQVENTHYEAKFDFHSSHQRALERVAPNTHVLNLGCGPRELVEPFVQRGARLSVVDDFVSKELTTLCEQAHQANLDYFDFEELEREISKVAPQAEPHDSRYATVLALDIIEHLRSPEEFLQKLRNSSACIASELVITTPNVTFFPVRLVFALGWFNYGKRGILDRTHTRLFTFGSLQRILQDQGFEVLEMSGIPAPFPLAVGRTTLGRVLLRLNEWAIALSKGLFSYQIFVRARPLPTVAQLLRAAQQHAVEEAQRLDQAVQGTPSRMQ